LIPRRRFAGDVGVQGGAAPLLGVEAVVRQLLPYAVRLCARLVDLVHRHDDGDPRRFAWSIDSTVCGITPSSAPTTRMTMSVTEAPRARIEVNASWPGVEEDHAPAVVLHLVGADMLGDPPASEAVTLLSRIASSRVVFRGRRAP